MNGMRRLGAAAVMAAMVATGLGTATLEAKKGGNGGGGGGGTESTVCTYLKAVMDYEYTSPYVYVWAASLYSYYGCDK
jgi:hypothetical protein